METSVLSSQIPKNLSDMAMPDEDACRICWNAIIGKRFPIASKPSQKTITYAQMYERLSGIEPEYGPTSLCWACANDLNAAYKLLKKVEEKENRVNIPAPPPPRTESPEMDIKPLQTVSQTSSFEMVVIKVEPQDYSEVEGSEYEFENESEQGDFSSGSDGDEDFKVDEKVKKKPKRELKEERPKKQKKKRSTYRAPPNSGNLIQCVLCIYNTFIKENYVNHVQNHHKGQKLKCDGCDEIYDYVDELNEHRKEEHEFTEKYVLQKIPEKLVQPKAEIKQEIEEESVPETPPKIQETKEKEYKLDCLGRRIPLVRNYPKREIKWPRKERLLPIQCPLCPYTGIGKSNFRNHYRTRHNKQELQCDGCDLKFHLFYRLYRHREEVHKFTHEYVVDESLKVPEGTVYQAKTPKKKEPEDFNCPECNMVIKGPRRLQKHLLDVHKIEKERTIRDQRGMKSICNFCGKFVATTHLESHIQHLHPEQRDPLFCDYCGEKTKSKTALLRHFQSIHKLALKYRGAACALMCRYCSRVFKSQHQREAHEVRLHTFDYKYRCELCAKKFLKKSHLASHVQRHAKGNMKKTHIFCHICGENFARRTLLAEHLTIHMNDPDAIRMALELNDAQAKRKSKKSSLNCHVCGEKFTRKKLLAEHLESHLNNYSAGSSRELSNVLGQNLAHLVALKYEQQEQENNSNY